MLQPLLHDLWRGVSVMASNIFGPPTTTKTSDGLSSFGDARVSQFEPLCGWTFAYNINPAIVNSGIISTGTVSHSGSFAVLSTGTASDGMAAIETVKSSRYVTGVGALGRFTSIFNTPVANSKQMIGVGDVIDGWFFGYNGTQFGICRINNSTENWIYQTEWNQDQRPDLDQTKGNVYEIKYQWLGFGAQTFSIEDQYGMLRPVHVILYANKHDDVSVQNPNLPISAWVENDGNTTNITMKTPSAVAGVEGDSLNDAISIVLAESVTKTLTTGTSQPVMSFYNPVTYQGKNNRLFVQALRLSIASEGNKPLVFRVLANAIPTGGTWADINTDITPIQVNKTFTSVTGGVQIGSFALGKADNNTIDLTGSKFKGFPGQYITIVADTTSASDVVTGVAFRQYL